jgi:hypothetical protein
VTVEKAQEIAPLLGGEGRVNRVAGSEPNLGQTVVLQVVLRTRERTC